MIIDFLTIIAVCEYTILKLIHEEAFKIWDTSRNIFLHYLDNTRIGYREMIMPERTSQYVQLFFI